MSSRNTARIAIDPSAWLGVRFASLAVLSLLVLALLVLGSSGACAPANSGASEGPADAAGAGAAKDGKKDAKDEAIAVAALPLQRGPIESVLRYSTNLEAEIEVKVFSEAARQVTELLIEEGRRVRKGQVLARLQDDEQQSAVSKVQSQLDKARREYQRQRKLYEQELISEQAFSQSTYELEQLEISLADAQRELGYAEVTAPISGTITQRLVNLGDHVQRNQRLFDIVDFDSIVARVFVPEKELRRLGPGQPARIVVQALGGGPRAASILRIAPTVDARSGTVKVTLQIHERERLVPGMYVEAELVAGTDAQALLVPKRALVYDQDQVYVFRVADALGKPRAEKLLIHPALENQDFVQVTEAVAEGDLIVVAGQAGLKDGATVRLLELKEAIEMFAGGASSVSR